MIVRNGDIDLHVAVDGDPEAPPILLLHGITSSSATWGWFVPELAERFRVLRLDFRGHGGSGRAPGEYTREGYVSDAVAVLEQAAGRPAVVMGHSLGALTTAVLAQDHGELVVATVMEDPPIFVPAPGERPTLEGNTLLDGFRLMRRSIPQLQEAGLDVATLVEVLGPAPDPTRTSTFGAALHPDALEALAEALIGVDASVLDPVLDGAMPPWVDHERPIPGPALLVAGDPAMPDTAARPRPVAHFAGLSDETETLTVAGAGHLIHDGVDSRSTFRDAAIAFLDRVAGA